MTEPEAKLSRTANAERQAEIEAATLRLRLEEAAIYRDFMKAVRRAWAIAATLSTATTLGALGTALAPYLGSTALKIPIVVSYISAFVVVIAAAFAIVSGYRTAVASRAVAHASWKIKRAQVTAKLFGRPQDGSSSND